MKRRTRQEEKEERVKKQDLQEQLLRNMTRLAESRRNSGKTRREMLQEIIYTVRLAAGTGSPLVVTGMTFLYIFIKYLLTVIMIYKMD